MDVRDDEGANEAFELGSWEMGILNGELGW
jgi:hypothetical protein